MSLLTSTPHLLYNRSTLYPTNQVLLILDAPVSCPRTPSASQTYYIENIIFYFLRTTSRDTGLLYL